MCFVYFFVYSCCVYVVFNSIWKFLTFLVELKGNVSYINCLQRYFSQLPTAMDLPSPVFFLYINENK